MPALPGIDHSKVVSYIDVIKRTVSVGKSVAIIGAGGIGFDVAEFLAEDSEPISFSEYWGIDFSVKTRGGIDEAKRRIPPAHRKIYLLQRTEGKLGLKLAKTTGWIRRTTLKDKNVIMMDSVNYEKIDDLGLHIERKSKKEVLAVDHVVICAGQEPLRVLFDDLVRARVSTHLIGGADVATELDAKRAINQGVRLAASI